MFKSGFVTIIGRPNVGKSTLINYIMGEKLSIVSNRPQTTRNNIQTILTTKDSQIIFVDTPGMHKPRHKLGEYMVKVAQQSTSEVDVILFITTPGDEIDKGDMHILEQLKDGKIPVFLLVNKIDENTQERVAKTIQSYSEYFNFKEIIPMAAIKGKNVDIVTKLVAENIPEGPLYYPEDMITDQQERFIITEIIREKALKLLSQEVPHGIAIEIISMKRDARNMYHIEANLLCEKDSHKGIIIGKGGKTLKQISTYARQDVMKFLGEKVNLRLWVKVKKEWRDTSSVLKELGYK
ncbi:GTPase Era [Clostridium sp. FP1]|uniref:GTPase Era n=1 Tax=Clostridium sp. FP1 TaxID=2724076 RepID=UPI0013E999C9|nr:GTPase Era [Clostridium sp. FP1]MBZ9636088.1 GTPase Era [Clostridium sp. FP1]